jgi:Flp pilus assembly protein TadG
MKPTQAPREQADWKPAAEAVAATTPRASEHGGRRASGGQVLVIFAAALVTLLSLSAVVIDVSWYWANTLRVQRAADAAALAGVVNLPGNVAGADAAAVTAAGQNGYALTNGCKADNITPSSVPGICASQDSANDRQLDVAVSAPVSTFFMRLLGINSITATRASKALYVLPVPMGSPLSYLGVGCFRTQSGGQPVCTTAGNSNGASGIPNATVVNPVPLTGPTAPSQLSSQGFFDAAITKGGDSGNGDAYDPTADSGRGGTNPTYNPAGVYYEVLIPAGDSNGGVSIFDPGYCAVNSSYGTGDHWIGTSGTPVSTYYNLWNTNGNVYATSQFSLVTASGTLFENQTGSDTTLGGPGSLPACDAYHDKWWQMTTGLAPGLYYLQVTTTKVLTSSNGGQTADPAGTTINASTNAENMYSLEATATGATTPQVFGAGRMVAYNNVNGGDQQFYLAQIPKIDAGKTLEIDLFDVGDVSGQAILYVESPDGNVYTNATFNYTADSMCASSCSANGVTSITATTSGGTHPYNDSWLTILIPLPSTYGSVGLTPGGETQAGWWKIDYKIAAGVQSNDTTTWRVGVRGNPVHLIVP